MYRHVVLGGTFDHLHGGHEDLLLMAFASADKVTIGLTKATMNTSKILAREIQAYKLRRKALRAFAQVHGRAQDIQIIPINDVYGTTDTDSTLEAIIVTPHSIHGAKLINAKRKENGLSALDIKICPLRTNGNGDIISSTQIRLGTMNRKGFAYRDIFAKDVEIVDETKRILKRPFGKATGARFLRSSSAPKIVVGDMCTLYCITHAIPFDTAFIDKKTKRKSFSFPIPPQYTSIHNAFANPAGIITAEAATYIHTNAINGKNVIVEIAGEEDLLTVAAIILLPLGTEVIYGYPYTPSGVRVIRVTESLKEKMTHFLSLLAQQ